MGTSSSSRTRGYECVEELLLMFKFLLFCRVAASFNKPLKFVPATKSVASTGLANARRLAER